MIQKKFIQARPAEFLCFLRNIVPDFVTESESGFWFEEKVDYILVKDSE